MHTFTKKDENIFNDLKAYFKESGLPLKAEKRKNAFMVIESEFKYKEHSAGIDILLDPSYKDVIITIDHGIAESEKIAPLYELIDRINMKLVTSHFIVCPDTGHVALLGGMHFTYDRINKKEFLRILRRLICESCIFVPLIVLQVDSDEKPEALWDQFVIKNKDEIDNRRNKGIGKTQ